MKDSIIIIVPQDAPEVTVFKIPEIKKGHIFERAVELNGVDTPTLCRMEDSEMEFLLENLPLFDADMYIVDSIPDYTFTPKWVNYMTKLDVVAFDALSQLLDAYLKGRQQEDMEEKKDDMGDIPRVDDPEEVDPDPIAPLQI